MSILSSLGGNSYLNPEFLIFIIQVIFTLSFSKGEGILATLDADNASIFFDFIFNGNMAASIFTLIFSEILFDLLLLYILGSFIFVVTRDRLIIFIGIRLLSFLHEVAQFVRVGFKSGDYLK